MLSACKDLKGTKYTSSIVHYMGDDLCDFLLASRTPSKGKDLLLIERICSIGTKETSIKQPFTQGRRLIAPCSWMIPEENSRVAVNITSDGVADGVLFLNHLKLSKMICLDFSGTFHHCCKNWVLFFISESDGSARLCVQQYLSTHNIPIHPKLPERKNNLSSH